MTTERHYQEALTRLEQHVDGFIAAAFVDVDTGMTMVAHALRPEFDLAAASAYNSELVKQKRRTLSALGLEPEVEDVLITLRDQIHLIRPVSATAFLYLVADRAKTNLALVKSAAAKAAGVLAGAEHVRLA
jgi:predicted regulator of Ras-like GTPase activity (Roadblock/LC7/MglB family)